MKNNLILKVNEFYISHMYLSVRSLETKFIQDVEFSSNKNLAKHFSFNEAYELLNILGEHFTNIEIEEDSDYAL